MTLPWYIRFLKWLARRQAPRVIPGRNGQGPYLTRYFLTKRGKETEGIDETSAACALGLLDCRHRGVYGFCHRCGAQPPIKKKAPRLGLYLHNFHRSDDDGELHNHPFKGSVSLVLVSGYSEERRIFDPASGESCVIRRRVRPWTFNFIFFSTFHRVDLIDGQEAWSLFLVWGLTGDGWGFWNRETDVYTPHKEFLDDLEQKRVRT
jgi:hypothetical protein